MQSRTGLRAVMHFAPGAVARRKESRTTRRKRIQSSKKEKKVANTADTSGTKRSRKVWIFGTLACLVALVAGAALGHFVLPQSSSTTTATTALDPHVTYLTPLNYQTAMSSTKPTIVEVCTTDICTSDQAAVDAAIKANPKVTVDVVDATQEPQIAAALLDGLSQLTGQMVSSYPVFVGLNNGNIAALNVGVLSSSDMNLFARAVINPPKQSTSSSSSKSSSKKSTTSGTSK